MQIELAHTIGALGRPSFYAALAAFLKTQIEYDNIIALMISGRRQPTVLFKDHTGPDVFRRLEEDYLSAAYLLDPFHHLHLKDPQKGIFKLMDIAPDHFGRSKYYEWYYGDLGITDEITLFYPLAHRITATISLGKSGVSGKHFQSRAERRLREAEPVLFALLKAHWGDAFDKPLVHNEGPTVVETLMGAMITHHGIKLSPRQAEVALLILQGHSSLSASLKLDLSPQTIKVFRKQLYKKCHISSQAELFSLMVPLLQQVDAEKEG